MWLVVIFFYSVVTFVFGCTFFGIITGVLYLLLATGYFFHSPRCVAATSRHGENKVFAAAISKSTGSVPPCYSYALLFDSDYRFSPCQDTLQCIFIRESSPLSWSKCARCRGEGCIITLKLQQSRSPMLVYIHASGSRFTVRKI